MKPEPFTQPQLAVAVVDRCGGRSRFVPWEEVAVAIWRAFPEKASLRSGHLPDTYSIQTWVWDAKTKLGFLEGGNREGGWRVTSQGAAWLDFAADLRDELRQTLLNSDEYADVNPQQLITTCVSGTRRSSRSSLVVEAFRRYPAVFGVPPDAGWPDAATVDASLEQAVSRGYLKRTVDAYELTAEGLQAREKIAAMLGLRLDEARGRGRAIAEQYVRRVEATEAYRVYLDTGDDDRGDDIEFYRTVRCPPNAPMNLLDASIAELLDNLSRANRPELRDFMERWAHRVLPDMAKGGGQLR